MAAAGSLHRNADGSEDLGVMQVNTVWLHPLSHLTHLSESDIRGRLLDRPCFNIAAAGLILHLYLTETQGDLLRAIGDYHSHTQSSQSCVSGTGSAFRHPDVSTCGAWPAMRCSSHVGPRSEDPGPGLSSFLAHEGRDAGRSMLTRFSLRTCRIHDPRDICRVEHDRPADTACRDRRSASNAASTPPVASGSPVPKTDIGPIL